MRGEQGTPVGALIVDVEPSPRARGAARLTTGPGRRSVPIGSPLLLQLRDRGEHLSHLVGLGLPVVILNVDPRVSRPRNPVDPMRGSPSARLPEVVITHLHQVREPDGDRLAPHPCGSVPVGPAAGIAVAARGAFSGDDDLSMVHTEIATRSGKLEGKP